MVGLWSMVGSNWHTGGICRDWESSLMVDFCNGGWFVEDMSLGWGVNKLIEAAEVCSVGLMVNWGDCMLHCLLFL